MSPTKKTDRAVRTRRSILDRLKEAGPQDAQSLAEQLGISAMAVRQHLYGLEEEKLVDHEEEPRAMGRPAKMWRLTRAADKFYPNGHAELTVDLLRSIRSAFGEKGMERLLKVRARQQIAHYSSAMPKTDSLKKRVRALAKMRTQEGYMAGVQALDDGALLLVENHCPICEAASECQGICAIELEVFSKVLGTRIRVERTDHIQAGARRCAYRVEPK